MKRRLLAAGIAVLAIAASVMIATMSAATADPLATGVRGGPTPNSQLVDALKEIHVDDTQYKVVETLFGVGKQVYDCGTDKKYAFREPMAGLFTTRGLPAGIHGKGPFWADFDGSKVVGTTVATVLSPAGPTNVAWLKVAAVQAPNGNFGTGVLSKVAFIQRTDTRGGAAPTTPCAAPSTVSVDYTTFYVFWAPR